MSQSQSPGRESRSRRIGIATIAPHRHERGVTLVELILVILVLGVIGGSAAVYLASPIRAYFDTARLAQLTDAADTATRRMLRGDELVFSSGDGVADTTMVFNGTVAALNAALNGMVLVASAGVSGVGNVTGTVDDQGGSGSGGPLVGSGSLAIVVGNAPLIDLDADNSGTGAAGDGRSERRLCRAE